MLLKRQVLEQQMQIDYMAKAAVAHGFRWLTSSPVVATAAAVVWKSPQLLSCMAEHEGSHVYGFYSKLL